MLVFQLFTALVRQDVLAHRAINVPFGYIDALMTMTAARVELNLERIGASLNRLSIQRERDELYARLLGAGAPLKFLRRHFARSRRDVEGDRQRFGVAARHKGRPARLAVATQYEVAGHWERLVNELHDPAVCLGLLLDAFPQLSVQSICSLLEQLGAAGNGG